MVLSTDIVQLPPRAIVETDVDPMLARKQVVKKAVSAVIDGTCLGVNTASKVIANTACRGNEVVASKCIDAATITARNELQSRVSDCVDKCFEKKTN